MEDKTWQSDSEGHDEMSFRSHLEKVLKKEKFAVTAELGPPRGADAERVKEEVSLLKSYVDAANVTDNQSAVVYMSSWAACVLMLEEGLEPVFQITCRDRNRLALQSDLLGASALGIRNVLLLTGDHPSIGDHPEAKGVFDLDSQQLIKLVRKMRDEGKLLNDKELSKNPEFFIGAAASPFNEPMEAHLIQMERKVQAGVEFFQTQIVYDLEKFSGWMKEVKERGITEKVFILAGVAPIKSLGMAKYMKNYVPGVSVPDEIIKRMEKARDKKEEGLKICLEIIEGVKKLDGVSGIHIMAIGWEEVVPEIVKESGVRGGRNS
jgi:5,10-methylenetetrahydrofolate reductase